MKLILRKGMIQSVISKTEYLVKDIFNDEIINMTISGKTRMIYSNLNLGDEIYIIVSSFYSARGRIANPSNFKMDNDLFEQKIDLDLKQSQIGD